MQKYKACCNFSCMLHNCEIRKGGGCYCACGMHDLISNLERTIDGYTLARGCITFPSQEKRDMAFLDLCEAEQIKEVHYREIEAPEMLEWAKKVFKEKFCTDDQ